MKVVDGSHDGAMFVNDGSEKGATNTAFAGKCWICKQSGHRKDECPERKTERSTTTGNMTKQETVTGTQLFLDAVVSENAKDYDELHFMFHMMEQEFTFFRNLDNSRQRSPITENRVESYARNRFHHGRFVGPKRQQEGKRQQLEDSSKQERYYDKGNIGRKVYYEEENKDYDHYPGSQRRDSRILGGGRTHCDDSRIEQAGC